MEKLDGKVAVITGGSSGMALAGAKLFVEQGAHVFISGRRQEALHNAVKLWASAGMGEERKPGQITEHHFDATFALMGIPIPC